MDSNIFEHTKMILLDTSFEIAFFKAISNAFLLISLAIILQLLVYFAIETAIAPLPVHKSNALENLLSFIK